MLKKTLRKLEIGLEDPPYNYIIHSAPFNAGELPHYRWHIEIFPRLAGVAGFEWGSGFYINPSHRRMRLSSCAESATNRRSAAALAIGRVFA